MTADHRPTVLPDVDPTDYYAPRYEPQVEYVSPWWWPYALGAAVIVAVVAGVTVLS